MENEKMQRWYMSLAITTMLSITIFAVIFIITRYVMNTILNISTANLDPQTLQEYLIYYLPFITGAIFCIPTMILLSNHATNKILKEK